ncbi:hypothetical protein [Hymenobacter sp. GOD-10R]|uniref:hypothetical protein n=1 Tax=Hymenobacter sp. GOD-10R TaxID=3093922 RepID=UPI002D78CFE4|nr:hypothetical protein [Hymenobacter sp. GOD-10R]WRQ28462.1 hypothetical protein SD425_25675 [Hymenobacter sp. GOD-10R]
MSLVRTVRLLRWFTRPFSGQEGSYWRAVTACFLAASTFWLLNALNKTYTTRITYPVVWQYDTKRYVPLSPLPTEVAVNVTGRGWKLLRKNLMIDVKPAEVRLRRLPATRFVTGSTLRPVLQASMEGLQFNYMLTDTLWVEFDRRVRREIPLALSPAANGSALPYAARFQPASVVFEGPASMVNRLSNPYPVHLPQAPAGSSNGDISVPIGGPALVRTNVEAVRVRLQPRPLITKVVAIAPALQGFPADSQFVLTPQMVQVQIQCFPEDTALLDVGQLHVLLQYHPFKGPHMRLQPIVSQVPAFTRGVSSLTHTVRVSRVQRP